MGVLARNGLGEILAKITDEKETRLGRSIRYGLSVQGFGHTFIGFGEQPPIALQVAIDPDLVRENLAEKELRMAGAAGPLSQDIERMQQLLVLAPEHAAAQAAGLRYRDPTSRG